MKKCLHYGKGKTKSSSHALLQTFGMNVESAIANLWGRYHYTRPSARGHADSSSRYGYRIDVSKPSGSYLDGHVFMYLHSRTVCE